MALGASEFYRLFAVRCLEIAREVADSDNKATLLAMAQMWFGLAERADAENTDQPTIIYLAPHE